jgi:arylsulfatase
MWVHEGGISTPAIVHWPRGISERGRWTDRVAHVIDLAPTLYELAGAVHPAVRAGRPTIPLEGRSFAEEFRRNASTPERELAWEHEGNRAIRVGNWKLVARAGGPWELYDLSIDRTETHDLSAAAADRVRELERRWTAWASRVGVVPWNELPGAKYRPSVGYRKKSEAVEPAVEVPRPGRAEKRQAESSSDS